MENKDRSKYDRAQRRITKIKCFYNHVGIFVIINGTLLLLKDKMTVAFFGKAASGNPDLMNWIDWNIYIWMVIVAIHALLVFGKLPFFIKKWEQRQIQKYMEKEKK